MYKKTMVRDSFMAALVACTVFAAPNYCKAGTIQLISNGSFEDGNFTGWTVTDQAGGNGSWYISTPGARSPVSSETTAANPWGGSYFAVSDETGPGSHVLLQSFTVPVGTTSLALSYQMFANDYDGGPYDNGLDYTVTPTENARVDILTAGAGAFSIAPSDIVTNMFVGADPLGDNPNQYTSYSYNLTGLLPGSTYQLRFAEADNQSYFNMGVDNVSLLATVPEPATLTLLGSALLGLGVFYALHCNARSALRPADTMTMPTARVIPNTSPHQTATTRSAFSRSASESWMGNRSP